MFDLTDEVKSRRCDRIRAAVIALEKFDKARQFCEKPVTQFNMDTWFCGTAACAGGYLALLPEFQEKGLKVKVYGSRARRHDMRDEGESGSVTYSIFTGLDALSRFFNIPYAVASAWFLPGRYGVNNHADIKPKDVAAKMRAYLRHYGEETGTVAPKKSERRPNYLEAKLAAL
jgi:hypothetical protein